MFNFLQRFARKKPVVSADSVIRSSALFDEAYYLGRHPDVHTAGVDPAIHYLLHGGFEGRNPSPHFDSRSYLEHHPDVKSSGMNPLLHYLLHGISEDRKIAPEQPEVAVSQALEPNPVSWAYPVQLFGGVDSGSTRVRYLDQSIRNYVYGHAIAHWEPAIQAFWQRYTDRYYEFFVMADKIKPGHLLDVGAEFYNKYIKEVLSSAKTLTVVDIKEPDHPDIQIVQGLNHYYKFDMTADDYSKVAGLCAAFDTVLSFGVLSYYDFTADMCARYIDNLVGFLKPDGLAVIKVDQHAILKHDRFPPFPVLHGLISDRFAVVELDVLTDADQEFYIYYCRKKYQTVNSHARS